MTKNILIALTFVGCSDAFLTGSETHGAGTRVGPTTGDCVPSPPTPEHLCNPEEPAPAPPVPPGGICDIELRLDSMSFTKGQGFSDGRAEASVTISITDDFGQTTTVREPTTGSLKMDVDTSRTPNTYLATYAVQENQQRTLTVCGTFREHDGDVIDINGDDDVGTDCDTVTLTCPQLGDNVDLQANLCRGGDCSKLRGAMAADVKVIAEDADGDCVSNDDDYTPEPCDEAWKGQLCRSSLVYFHYGDGALNTLVQHVGTDLSKAMQGYDRVVLLIDDTQVGPFKLDPAAFNLADVVMEPTEDTFFASLQDLTARGCDMDVWIYSHGSPTLVTQDDGRRVSNGGEIEALADDDGGNYPDITTHELLVDTDPANSGTAAVPVRMTYGTPCFYNEWSAAWQEVGAKVTSGAVDLNFNPLFYGNFADDWNGGDTYGVSLANEPDPLDEQVAFLFIQGEGTLPPWLCVGNTVRGNNACAEDFFIDSDDQLFVDSDGHIDDGPDDAAYSIGGPLWDSIGIAYDTGVSGATNMRRSSTKALLGMANIRKDLPATLSWP